MTRPNSPREHRAIDLMSTDVLTVPIDLSLEGLALFLAENRITGVPVVDSDGNLVGVVSETDLVRHQARSPRVNSDDWEFFRSLDLDEIELLSNGFRIEELDDTIVADIMSTKLVTAHENTAASELAASMLSHKVHRILILRNRKLAGIVTTVDILREVASRSGGSHRESAP